MSVVEVVMRARRSISFGLVTGFTWGYLEFVGQILDRIDLDEEDLASEDGEEGEDDSLFIPMGWATKRPRQYYRGSDPEWQAYLQIARDPKRRENIQFGLVDMIRTNVANAPSASALGQIDVRRGRWWLDLFFPDGPPIEYERAGIEISDDFVSWTKKPVSQVNQQRLVRALWPTAAFSSMYATSCFVFTANLEKVQKLLGMQTATEKKMEALQNKLVELRSLQQSAAKSTNEPSGTSFQDAADGNSSSAPSPPKQQPEYEVHRSSDSPQTGTKKETNVQLPQLHPPSSDFRTLATFRQSLNRNWKGLRLEPPRGTVVVQGRVEVLGSKARAIVEVIAAFDPQRDKFVVVKGAVRAVQKHSQPPRGGD